MAAKELLAQLHEVAANPRKQLDKYLAEGKKVVAVTYYTPQEIVHSMGLVPMGVWGADMEINEAKKYYPAFICSIMPDNPGAGNQWRVQRLPLSSSRLCVTP